MKLPQIALVAAISLFATGNSWAQNNWSNSNNTSNFGGSFGNSSFSQTSNNMTISQLTGSGADSFCQFFSYSFGLTQIIQIIQGNSMTQVFGSNLDPVTDPCL
ncbi:MAG: hypothetical protein FD165_1889 [Gammaproteobacteria bacterium]|nr:MAG: hypothetical protein FD165_1889 [Gammaproteobacteria bacterium]TND04461.1 MAG: hypothetical protein FD120_1575 [Gammaproteobacteria bacterium]